MASYNSTDMLRLLYVMACWYVIVCLNDFNGMLACWISLGCCCYKLYWIACISIESMNDMAPQRYQKSHLLIARWVQRGKLCGRKPKDPKIWDKIAKTLDIPNYLRLSGVQVMGKINSLKADYKAFQFLKGQTGVGWDEEKDNVDADKAWWT